MKTNKLRTLLIVSFTTISIGSFAQGGLGDMGAFLRSGVGDAEKIMKSYTSPLLKGFAQGLNDGWYNTARPLGLGGFDLRVNFGAAFVPSKDQSFDFTGIGLNTDPAKARMKLPAGTSPNLPTMYGKSGATSDIQVWAKVGPSGSQIDTMITKFQAPPGLGVSITPSLPMAQLSVGIIKETELTLRFFPETQIGDFKAGIMGFGVKHSIKQWIPAISEMPMWDWSGFFGYTSFSSQFVTSKPFLAVDTAAYNPNPSVNYNNQKVTFSGSGWTIGTMVSIKLGPITPYLGLNYSSSEVTLKMEGNYPITTPNDEYDPLSTTKNKLTKIMNAQDPITLSSGPFSSMRANGGLRIKLLILTIYGEYSLGTYDSFTAGIGLNLQSIKPFKL